MCFLPVLSWSLIIADNADHQRPEDVNTNPVGDIQTVNHFSAKMNKHHQNNLKSRKYIFKRFSMEKICE